MNELTNEYKNELEFKLIQDTVSKPFHEPLQVKVLLLISSHGSHALINLVLQAQTSDKLGLPMFN
jgi:hypothetical protein